MQACQTGIGANVFGIGTVDSADIGDVSEYGWTFKISYNNTVQNKNCEVTYTLAATSVTKFTFVTEDPPGTYVSCSF